MFRAVVVDGSRAHRRIPRRPQRGAGVLARLRRRARRARGVLRGRHRRARRDRGRAAGHRVPADSCGRRCARSAAGSTISYGELAARVGAPGAARAVGTANATNPICLVIPCHRVVRTGGALGGYGFGVDRKRWLLAHEARPDGLFGQPAEPGSQLVRPRRTCGPIKGTPLRSPARLAGYAGGRTQQGRAHEQRDRNRTGQLRHQASFHGLPRKLARQIAWTVIPRTRPGAPQSRPVRANLNRDPFHALSICFHAAFAARGRANKSTYESRISEMVWESCRDSAAAPHPAASWTLWPKNR